MCEFESSSSTSASVAPSSSSGATARLTSPMRAASAPSIMRPVMISSLARPRPTTAGSREEPPTSGISPSLTSGSPSCASLATTRRSHPSATSSAPPMHARWIWQTTGLGIDSQRLAHSRNTSRNGRKTPGLPACCASSPRSTPAEKTGPEPRSTTQRTASSAAASASAAASSCRSCWLIALRFSGRLRTTWRTAPRSSVMTMLIAAAPDGRLRAPGAAARGCPEATAAACALRPRRNRLPRQRRIEAEV